MPGTVRPMPARDRHQPHRVATQIELFFDLVSVISIAALTAGYHHAISAGHGLDMLPNFLFLFLAIWWAWMNFTWFASAFDNDDPLTRLGVMAIMAGLLIFAGGVVHIFQTFDFGVGPVGWTLMRLAQAGLWLRAARHNPRLAEPCRRYAVGICLAQAGWLLVWLGFTPGSAAMIGAGIAVFALEFAVPVWAEWRVATPWHRHHIVERYGLFNIIVLGEGLLSVALTFGALYEQGFDAATAATALAGLVIVFLLFWLYFGEHDHLAADDNRTAFLWGYGHVTIFAAGALIGAGLAASLDVAAHHSELPPSAAARYVAGPAAVYLAGLWFVRDRARHLGVRGLALPVAALVAALAAGAGLGPWAIVLILVVALVWRVPFAVAPARAEFSAGGSTDTAP